MKNNFIYKTLISLSVSSFLLMGCQQDEITSDAFGNFDVDETIISAEAAGELEAFTITEGATLKAGQVVGSIDSTNLVLERDAIAANKKAVSAQLTSISAEINVLNVQLKVVEKEQKRVVKLLESDAATQKQLDDVNGNVEIIKSKIQAANAKRPAVLAQLAVINANINKVNNFIDKCTVTNPVDGVVITKLAEAHELVGPGKPIYKVANPSKVYLKAYVTGSQLSGLKIGQKVTIITDDKEGGLNEIPGIINWISEEAEFTPKLIQTREERVSLVYAIKVGFENTGIIKIGMPGEVKF